MKQLVFRAEELMTWTPKNTTSETKVSKRAQTRSFEIIKTGGGRIRLGTVIVGKYDLLPDRSCGA
jgi:hypothetical protein